VQAGTGRLKQIHVQADKGKLLVDTCRRFREITWKNLGHGGMWRLVHHQFDAGVDKVADNRRRKVVLLLGSKVAIRKSRKCVKQIERSIREECIEQPGLIALINAKLRYRAFDIEAPDLSRSEPKSLVPDKKFAGDCSSVSLPSSARSRYIVASP